MLATRCDSILPLRHNLVADFSQSFSILNIAALRGSPGHAVHQIFPFDLFFRLRRAWPAAESRSAGIFPLASCAGSTGCNSGEILTVPATVFIVFSQVA